MYILDYIFTFYDCSWCRFPWWSRSQEAFLFSCLTSLRAGGAHYRVTHLKDRTLISLDEIKWRHNSQTFCEIKNTPFFIDLAVWALGAYSASGGTRSEYHILLCLTVGQMYELWETLTWSTAQLKGYMFMFLAVCSTSINPHKEKEGYMLPFVNLVPMEMAASVDCVEGCSVGGGKLKWRLIEKGEGQRLWWKGRCLPHFIIHSLPPWSSSHKGCVVKRGFFS